MQRLIRALSPPKLQAVLPQKCLCSLNNADADSQCNRNSVSARTDTMQRTLFELGASERPSHARPQFVEPQRGMRDVRTQTLRPCRQDAESEEDFAAGDGDTQHDEDDDDPRDSRHLLVCDRVGEDLG